DRISTAGLRVFVNGVPLPLTVTDDGSATGLLRGLETIGDSAHGIQVDLRLDMPQLDTEVTVPEHAYFVMGDFRNNSVDSRAWGFVREDRILGSASRLLVSVAEERALLASLGERLQ